MLDGSRLSENQRDTQEQAGGEGSAAGPKLMAS